MAVVNVRVGQVGQKYTALYLAADDNRADPLLTSAFTVPTAWARDLLGKQPRSGERFPANFARRRHRIVPEAGKMSTSDGLGA